MSIQFDIAKQIIAETCPNRKLKLENIRLFADINTSVKIYRAKS